MQLTYYGHSCFLLNAGGKNILFDPFLSGNPLAQHLAASDLRCDYVLLTHAHSDHSADVETVLKQNPDATLVGIWEVHDYYAQRGYKTHPMNKGGWWTFEFGRVKMVQAVHSSSFGDGTFGGEPVGFVVDTPEGVLYHAGDTALTLDMQLIPRICPALTAAILPIGGNFTMDYKDALLAAEFVQCKQIIGCHFDTFGFIKIDHEAATQAFTEAGYQLALPTIGQSWAL